MSAHRIIEAAIAARSESDAVDLDRMIATEVGSSFYRPIGDKVNNFGLMTTSGRHQAQRSPRRAHVIRRPLGCPHPGRRRCGCGSVRRIGAAQDAAARNVPPRREGSASRQREVHDGATRPAGDQDDADGRWQTHGDRSRRPVGRSADGHVSGSERRQRAPRARVPGSPGGLGFPTVVVRGARVERRVRAAVGRGVACPGKLLRNAWIEPEPVATRDRRRDDDSVERWVPAVGKRCSPPRGPGVTSLS